MGKNEEKQYVFGDRLKELLTEKGLSQREAAKIAGVAPSVIDGWVAGAQPENYNAVKKLAKYFKISFELLLTGSVETENSTEIMVSQYYNKVPFFTGLAEISIKQLIPKNKED